VRLKLKPRRKRRPGMMQFEVGATLHNRFDIEVRDAETGELKQKAQAENIILDQMWNRVCNFDEYHESIAFGTGTGTLDPTNTSLFDYYDDMESETEEIHKDIVANDSRWVKKIELIPEYPEAENGFLDITEVGVSYDDGSGNLVTHAMIEDAEGNPIVVEKTDTDIVTIYATVYVELDDTMGDNIDFTAGPNSTENVLLNYLVGDDSWPNMRWAVGLNGLGTVPRNGPAIGHRGFLMAETNWLHSDDNWTADPANAKVIAEEKRFPVEEGNLEAFDVGLIDDYDNGRDGLFRSIIPLTGVFEGYDVVDEELATGDGNTVRFTLPRRYIDETSVAFYLDGTETQDYSIEQYRGEAGNFAATNPTDAIPDAGYSVSFTSDDAYMAVAHRDAPYIAVYEFDKETGTIGAKLDDPTDALPNTGRSVAFTSDDAYMAVAHWNAPYITVYEFDKETGTIGAKLDNPTDGLPDDGSSVSFTSDDGYMAVAHTGAPRITVYEFDKAEGTIGAKLDNPTDAPWGDGNSVSFISDDTYMAVAHSNSPHITVYETGNEPHMDVIFDTAPGDGVAITYDAHLPYIPKDDDHVLDCQITIQFADANA